MLNTELGRGVYNWLLQITVVDVRVLSSQGDVGWRDGFGGHLQNDGHYSHGSSKMTHRVGSGSKEGNKDRF